MLIGAIRYSPVKSMVWKLTKKLLTPSEYRDNDFLNFIYRGRYFSKSLYPQYLKSQPNTHHPPPTIQTPNQCDSHSAKPHLVPSEARANYLTVCFWSCPSAGYRHLKTKYQFSRQIIFTITCLTAESLCSEA